jgi:thioredoxin family protein
MKKISLQLIIAICICGCVSNTQKKEGEVLQDFNLLLVDSTKFNTSNIANGSPIVLFYFDPDCFFCKGQTKEMLENISTFKNVKLYFLTRHQFSKLKNFYTSFQLQNYPEITIGQDSIAFFSRYYKPSGVPCTAIYDKNKKLKQFIMGKATIDEIKNAIST